MDNFNIHSFYKYFDKLIIIKSLTIFIIFTALILIFSSVSGAQADIRLSVSSSPSSLPAFFIQQNSDDFELETTIHRSRNVVISKLMKNEVDAALLSTNEAAKLYNKGVEVQIAGIHTWGIFYLLSSRKDISDWNDLKGLTIFVPDKGGPLDIIFQELLKNNNLDISKDLQIQRGKMREISQLMINNMAETAVLREPFVTQSLLKNNNTEVVFDLQEEWDKIYSFGIPQSALVFSKEFAENNPDLIRKFEESYISALNYLENNKNIAAELGAEYLEVDEKIILESYERLNLEYKRNSEVKNEIEKYLQTLMDYNKDTIGGNLPDEKFYIKN